MKKMLLYDVLLFLFFFFFLRTRDRVKKEHVNQRYILSYKWKQSEILIAHE